MISIPGLPVSASPSRLPSILLTISLKERLLIVLHGGPQTMSQLCQAAASPAKQTYRAIDQLRREGLVRRLGVRRTTIWALRSWRGKLPLVRVARARKKHPRPAPAPDQPSWWLVPADQFGLAAQARLAEKGWRS